MVHVMDTHGYETHPSLTYRGSYGVGSSDVACERNVAVACALQELASERNRWFLACCDYGARWFTPYIQHAHNAQRQRQACGTALQVRLWSLTRTLNHVVGGATFTNGLITPPYSFSRLHRDLR